MEELQQCQGERDEALLLQSALQRSVEELQSASQTSTHTKEERARHLKLMEVRRTGVLWGPFRGTRTY